MGTRGLTVTEPAAGRIFPKAVKSVRGEEPLLVGMIGPPGGGKTVSSLRLATGMRQVRGGPVVLIDTEGGRSRKYSEGYDFLRVDFDPPFRSHDFLAVIRQQLPLKPSAIIVDSLSDEHEGEGGYLEWHDDMVPSMGGNEWAAWAKPKAARKRLISGLLQIKVPLIFTFRAREKTAQKPREGSRKADIVNIGWMPVAPLEIIHALDLTCILPPRADGVPIWSSEKIGEGFIVKLPTFLRPCIHAGQLSEETGAALARWASGAEAAGPGERGTLLAEIQERIASVAPGATDAARAARLATMESAFGVKSWKAIQGLPVESLSRGLLTLRSDHGEIEAADAAEGAAPTLFATDQPPPDVENRVATAEEVDDLHGKARVYGAAVAAQFGAWLVRQYGEEVNIPVGDIPVAGRKIEELARQKKGGKRSAS
jgi:hypothetical protein